MAAFDAFAPLELGCTDSTDSDGCKEQLRNAAKLESKHARATTGQKPAS